MLIWVEWNQAIPIHLKTKGTWIVMNPDYVHGSEKPQLYFQETEVERCSEDCLNKKSGKSETWS